MGSCIGYARLIHFFLHLKLFNFCKSFNKIDESIYSSQRPVTKYMHWLFLYLNDQHGVVYKICKQSHIFPSTDLSCHINSKCTSVLIFSFTSLNLVFNTVNITWFLIEQHVSRYQMNTGYITGFLKHMSSFQYHFHDLISDFLFYSIMSFRAEWNYKGHSRAEYAWSSDMDSSAAHWCPTFHCL